MVFVIARNEAILMLWRIIKEITSILAMTMCLYNFTNNASYKIISNLIISQQKTLSVKVERVLTLS
ncbi:hypothetical protein DF947_02165 [Pedobacter paludis]|uniref:Uncharacterized protein n=1 Tax=Pedobacter paludis TaxID=2203212 RepID=A0A317F4G5_9SPHI|nr:hypothetical protein DF947_02165 [Pedobacter paludis]